MSEEIPKESAAAAIPRWYRWVRRCLGAGAYPALNRWLDPSRKYSQYAYARLLPMLIPTNAAWLDAGCGHQVYKLRSALDETEIVGRARMVIGCDLSWDALRHHRTLKMRACADLRYLPFTDQTFDLLTLNYVAEHLEEPEKTFVELARLLRPQGILVILTPNARGYFVKLTNFGRKFLPEALVRKFILMREFRSSEDVFPTFYRANTRSDLNRQMEQAGLKEEKFQLLNDPAAFSFIAPLAILELLSGRLLSFLGFKSFVGGTIIGVYRQTGEKSGMTEQRSGTVETMVASSMGAQ